MRVILLADVKKQGKKNDIIEVKDGYGTYLINNKLAVLETKGSSKVLKKQTEEAALEESLLLKDCEQIKEKLEKMTLNFKVNTGKNGQVFGQISTKQIADELKKKGFNIDKRKIKLDVPINTLGTTNVKVVLHKKVEATLKIHLRTGNRNIQSHDTNFHFQPLHLIRFPLRTRHITLALTHENGNCPSLKQLPSPVVTNPPVVIFVILCRR